VVPSLFESVYPVDLSQLQVLGGEGAHGMLILSPKAVQRLESYTPAWPMPKIFRMVKDGKLEKSIFDGSTINTPSMMCVEDYLVALNWAEKQVGLCMRPRPTVTPCHWRLRVSGCIEGINPEVQRQLVRH
jgi:phosphoserine aminotransferase